ncbi:RDD family protein [Hellea balneolensis]|uniref:RDD family protein n=1 Tax=Hellea balneolensis TaxID=287478 RepID=UPI0004281399|nr:RDD family protein [Hellea balneolensis]
MVGVISQRKVDQRRLITPEGIDLQVQLADIGARIGAYVIDQIIINVGLVAAFFLIVFGGISAGPEVAITIFILVNFFVRNFYYMFFEMGPKAATPGKRMSKIRVASRSHARLTANAVFARNALREIEINLPLSFLFMSGDSVDGWISLLGLLWSGIFLFFPLFNKDRLRAGDLIAGTWVVRAPKPILAKDLASEKADLDSAFIFTPEQVEAYGVHELHVLENVIRANEFQTVKDVAQRIRNKIKWSKGMSEGDLDFLKAYYAALRGRLETRLLFGVRRKDKFDKT